MLYLSCIIILLLGYVDVEPILDPVSSQFLPKLYEHLENEQVHISMFVTKWL